MPGPLALAAVPPAISALGSFIGGERANRAARQEAARNRQFQERMRNTQWQAAVEDMRAAGLNPALAYSQGPNAAPGGSMATQSDTITPAVSSGMQAIRLRKELDLLSQQAAKAKAEATTAKNEAWWSSERRKWYDAAQGPGLSMGTRSLALMKRDRLESYLESELSQRVAEVARTQGIASVAGLTGQVAGAFEKFMPAVNQIAGVAGRGAQSVADVTSLLERVANMRDDAVRAYFGAPKALVLKILRRFR